MCKNREIDLQIINVYICSKFNVHVFICYKYKLHAF